MMTDFTMPEDFRTRKMQKWRFAAEILAYHCDLDEKQKREVLADLEDLNGLGAVGFVKAMFARIAKSRGIA